MIPSEATISPGTTIIWINNTHARLQLKFIDKKVSLACAAPVNFSLDESKVFISTGIPLGGVASLCFVEKGEFKYKLIRLDQVGSPTCVRKIQRGNKGSVTSSLFLYFPCVKNDNAES